MFVIYTFCQTIIPYPLFLSLFESNKFPSCTSAYRVWIYIKFHQTIDICLTEIDYMYSLIAYPQSCEEYACEGSEVHSANQTKWKNRSIVILIWVNANMRRGRLNCCWITGNKPSTRSGKPISYWLIYSTHASCMTKQCSLRMFSWGYGINRETHTGYLSNRKNHCLSSRRFPNNVCI